MRIGSKIVHLISSLYVLLALTACVEEELRQPMLGKGEGYLTLQVGPISAEVQAAPLTKATTTLEAEEIPAVSELWINVTSDGTQVSGFPKHYAELSAPIVLPTGTYTVEAYYGENEALQATPYFYGSTSIEVKPNQNNTASFTVALGNAMITPKDFDTMAQHYENDWECKIKVNSEEQLLASAAGVTNTCFVKAGSKVDLIFTGTNKAGVKVSPCREAITSAEACRSYQLSCNPDLSAFENIQLTATATHTKNSDNDLDGTDITLDYNLNGANASAIASWQVEVKYNGSTIRSYTGETRPDKIDKTSDWPYIPQGSSIEANVKLKAGNVLSLTNCAFNLPQPDFSVSVTGTTSYDKYVAGDISGANAMNAETIENIGASLKIDDALLTNSNYNASFALTLDDAEIGSKNTPSSITYSDQTKQEWKTYTLKAIANFDGIEQSATKDCYITGLPYKPTNMIENDWKLASWNCKFKNNAIQLGGVSGSGECTATLKKAFQMPSNTSVVVSTNATIRDYYFWPKWYKTTFTVNVNAVAIITQKNQSDNDKGINYDLSKNTTFATGANTIKLNSSYELAGPWVKVHQFIVLYK